VFAIWTLLPLQLALYSLNTEIIDSILQDASINGVGWETNTCNPRVFSGYLYENATISFAMSICPSVRLSVRKEQLFKLTFEYFAKLS
jgi:hypothetical protein